MLTNQYIARPARIAVAGLQLSLGDDIRRRRRVAPDGLDGDGNAGILQYGITNLPHADAEQALWLKRRH